MREEGGPPDVPAVVRRDACSWTKERNLEAEGGKGKERAAARDKESRSS